MMRAVHLSETLRAATIRREIRAGHCFIMRVHEREEANSDDQVEEQGNRRGFGLDF